MVATMKKLIYKILGEPVWFRHDVFGSTNYARKGRLIRTPKHMLLRVWDTFYVVNEDGTGPENSTWWPR